MSQVSLPVRILLIGAVVFLAAWFTVLRPKPATVDPAPVAATPAGTPQTGFGRAVADARKAAGVAKNAAAKAAGVTPTATAAPTTTTATPSATATPAPAPVAIPAATLAKLPKSVSAALQARKTLVLGVISDSAKRWRPLADDDRYVRNLLDDVNRYQGQVLVKTVPVSDLVTYAPLVGNLDLSQTPSIVVIDGQLKGTVLAGYVDRVSVNQAIMDARRASITPYITDPFLRKANAVCADGSVSLGRVSLPTVRGKKPEYAFYRRALASEAAYDLAVSKLAAPAKWRPLKAAWVADNKRHAKLLRDLVKAAKRKDLAAMYESITDYDYAAYRKLDHRFDRAGLTSCSVLRPS